MMSSACHLCIRIIVIVAEIFLAVSYHLAMSTLLFLSEVCLQVQKLGIH